MKQTTKFGLPLLKKRAASRDISGLNAYES
jgi:hypothetical protein